MVPIRGPPPFCPTYRRTKPKKVVKDMSKLMYRLTNWLLGGQLERLVQAIGGGGDDC